MWTSIRMEGLVGAEISLTALKKKEKKRNQINDEREICSEC